MPPVKQEWAIGTRFTGAYYVDSNQAEAMTGTIVEFFPEKRSPYKLKFPDGSDGWFDLDSGFCLVVDGLDRILEKL